MRPPFQGRAQSAAFAAAALILLVPANILPVITISGPAQERTDTILSSIFGLFESGLWPLGVIVFIASIAVPLLKLWGLGWLLIATPRRREGYAGQAPRQTEGYAGQAPRQTEGDAGQARLRTDAERARLTRLYLVLDFIGRWSMLDVFLVAFLAGVVQFGAVASIHPGNGIFAFGAAVVLTMLATHAFDPRTLWQK